MTTNRFVIVLCLYSNDDSVDRSVSTDGTHEIGALWEGGCKVIALDGDDDAGWVATGLGTFALVDG